ncbi:MAG: sulfatase [Opitutaceae bacterium]|nr:sulfatase [Opitutaceae bacterium]
MTRYPARLFSIVLALLAPLLGVAAEPPTNIIFILVDDQGYYDLGCTGATEVKTPRIDALAAAGVRFTDYYAAAPICSPSRAGILTGRYPRRSGLEAWVQRADSTRGLPASELTLAQLLKSRGYATACIGKWHLGFTPELRPQRKGFDHYFGLLHNLDGVETVYFQGEGGVPLLRGDTVVQRPAVAAELTRRYTDEAIAFIEAQRSRPFFLYLAHTMLHEPLGVSDEFKGRSGWGLYGDATMELDHHTGRLVDALERLGLAANTTIVYASDNGRGPGRTPAQPLRGTKLTTLEAGIRVPAIVAGAGVRGGRVSSALVHAMDWFPTLATLAGVDVPADRILDGRDLAPLLDGRVETVPDPAAGLSRNAAVPLRRPWQPPGEWAPLITRADYLNAFFYHGAEGQFAAVRSGKWKLTLSPNLQLFDLEADPGEQRPVRDAATTRRLRGMAVMFQEEMNAARQR